MNTQSIGDQIMHEQIVDSVMHTINGGMTTAGMFGPSAKKKAEIKARDMEEQMKADEREERMKIERGERNKIKREKQNKIKREGDHERWAALDEAADRRVAGEKKHEVVDELAAAIELLRINGIKIAEPLPPAIAEAVARLEAEKIAYAKARYPHQFW